MYKIILHINLRYLQQKFYYGKNINYYFNTHLFKFAELKILRQVLKEIFLMEKN